MKKRTTEDIEKSIEKSYPSYKRFKKDLKAKERKKARTKKERKIIEHVLPEQLRDPTFRFIRLDGISKRPLKGEEWLKNLITWKEADDWLKRGFNVGVVGGFGRLRMLDIDQEAVKDGTALKIFKLLETYCVKTGGGGYHHYFLSDYEGNHKFKTLGELRSLNQYVVVAGSTHPDTKKKYVAHSDLPIKEMTELGLEKIFKVFGTSMRPEDEKMVVSPIKKPLRVIPDSIDKLIKEGVDKGNRHHTNFILVKELHNRGFKPNEIMDYSLTLNSNSRPPDNENVIRSHTNYLLKHKDKYLIDKVDKEWLHSQSWGIKASQEEEIKELVFISADKLVDMKDDLPKTEWLIEGLIPNSRLGMISGSKGHYKSFFAMRLALSIASGQEFCGRKVKKGKVLYFNEEITEAEFIERIEMITKGMGIDKHQPNLKCFFTRQNDSKSPQIDTESGRRQVENVIKKENPVLVIYDIMRRFHGIEENKADEVQRFYKDALKPMFEKNEIAVIGVFHHRKRGAEFKGISPFDVDVLDLMEEVRSSSEWVNVCSFFMSPKRFNSKSLFCGLYVYVRDEGNKTCFFRVEFKGKDAVFFTESDRDEIDRTELVQDNDRLKRITEWIEKNDIKRFRTKDIKKLFQNRLDNKQINRLLTQLIDAQIIKKVRQGVYERVILQTVSLTSLLEKKDISDNSDVSDNSVIITKSDNSDTIYKKKK